MAARAGAGEELPGTKVQESRSDKKIAGNGRIFEAVNRDMDKRYCL